MCGILLHYCADKQLVEDGLIEFPEGTEFAGTTCTNESYIFNRIIPYIAARGPNYSSLRVSKAYQTSWFSSVLSLRQPFTKQSISVDDRYYLQFNGELYNKEISDDDNDSQYIASLLQNLTGDGDVIDVIRMLEGEYAYTCLLYTSDLGMRDSSLGGAKATSFKSDAGKDLGSMLTNISSINA